MSGRVLLVDDDPDIREIARLSLERLGDFTVVAVGGSDAALTAAASEGPFDAVLLDVMMPGADGPATLERLRSGPLPPEVPVVFLTAKVQRTDRERLASLGAAGVIAKPFDPLGLAGEVAAIIDRAGYPAAPCAPSRSSS